MCIPISSIIDVIKSRIPFWLWHTRMYSIENFLCFTWISILNDTIMLVFKSMMDSYLRQKRMYFFIPTRVIHYVLLLLLFFVHLNVYQCLIKKRNKKTKKSKNVIKNKNCTLINQSKIRIFPLKHFPSNT